MSDVPPNPDPPTPPAPTEERKFTQEELNRFLTREKQEGAASATKALLEKLGVEKVEDVEAVLKAAREREEAEKTELQKLQDQLAQAQQAKEAELSTAKQELHTERVKARLMRAGVPLPEEGADSALDRLVSLVAAQVGASVEDIDTDITALKVQFPQLFTASAPAPTGTPSSTPSDTPSRTPVSGATAADKARALAQESNRQRGVQVPTA